MLWLGWNYYVLSLPGRTHWLGWFLTSLLLLFRCPLCPHFFYLLLEVYGWLCNFSKLQYFLGQKQFSNFCILAQAFYIITSVSHFFAVTLVDWRVLLSNLLFNFNSDIFNSPLILDLLCVTKHIAHHLQSIADGISSLSSKARLHLVDARDDFTVFNIS